MNNKLAAMNVKLGDFPMWGAILPLAPGAVCQFLGFSYAATFVVYMGMVSMIGIMVQLDRIDDSLQELNKHLAPEGSED